MNWLLALAVAVPTGLSGAGGLVWLLVRMDQGLTQRQGPRPYHAHFDGHRNRPCYARPCARFDAEQEQAA